MLQEHSVQPLRKIHHNFIYNAKQLEATRKFMLKSLGNLHYVYPVDSNV